MNKKDCVEIVLRLLDVRVLGHTYDYDNISNDRNTTEIRESIVTRSRQLARRLI